MMLTLRARIDRRSWRIVESYGGFAYECNREPHGAVIANTLDFMVQHKKCKGPMLYVWHDGQLDIPQRPGPLRCPHCDDGQPMPKNWLDFY